jgi:hypothetical protein
VSFVVFPFAFMTISICVIVHANTIFIIVIEIIRLKKHLFYLKFI